MPRRSREKKTTEVRVKCTPETKNYYEETVRKIRILHPELQYAEDYLRKILDYANEKIEEMLNKIDLKRILVK